MAASRSPSRTARHRPGRGSTTMRSARPGRARAGARWLVRACRSDGKSGPSTRIRRRRPAGRKNDASSRWRLTVSALRSATSAGRAPTIRAIGSRSASSSVNHGRSPRRTTRRRRAAAQASSSAVDRRADGPRLEPERLAGEVDRAGAPSVPEVGSRNRSRTTVSGSAASRARASASGACVGHRRIGRRVVSRAAGSAAPRARRPR